MWCKRPLYLKESCRLWDDASYPDLRLQRKRDGLDLREVHLLVVGQQSLQPLCLQTHTEAQDVNTSQMDRRVRGILQSIPRITLMPLYEHVMFEAPLWRTLVVPQNEMSVLEKYLVIYWRILLKTLSGTPVQLLVKQLNKAATQCI